MIIFSLSIIFPIIEKSRDHFLKIFFERVLDDFALHILADPAETQILIMPMDAEKKILDNEVLQALQTIGLTNNVSLSPTAWGRHDSIVSIPWNEKSDI